MPQLSHRLFGAVCLAALSLACGGLTSGRSESGGSGEVGASADGGTSSEVSTGGSTVGAGGGRTVAIPSCDPGTTEETPCLGTHGAISTVCVDGYPVPGYCTLKGPLRVSLHPSGAQSDQDVTHVLLSADGEHVAFNSGASTLDDLGSSGQQDVFVRDILTDHTERISVSSGGGFANSYSQVQAISWDGRFVVFSSLASNLVVDDTNGVSDVFVRDRYLKTTTRASILSDGTEGNGPSDHADISADGGTIVFRSFSSNLVTGDTNGFADLFKVNTATGAVERLAGAPLGSQGNGDVGYCRVDAAASKVFFQSDATNLVAQSPGEQGNLYVLDVGSGDLVRVNPTTSSALDDATGFNLAISGDGSAVAFATYSATIEPGVSGNFGNVYRFEVASKAMIRISTLPNHQGAFAPSLDFYGRLVAYHAQLAPSMGPSGANVQIFLHDVGSNVRELVSVNQAGEEANAMSFAPSLSANGVLVAFESNASNLVSGDTNTLRDAYVLSSGLAAP